MSGGVLALVIAAVVLICCLGPVALCVVGGLRAGLLPIPEPEPTVAIVSCEINYDDRPPRAEVQWELTNNGRNDGNWTVEITVIDAYGQQVADAYDWALGVAPGTTMTDQVTLWLNVPGGEACQIDVVS